MADDRKENLGGHRGFGQLPFLGTESPQRALGREAKATLNFRNELISIMGQKRHWASPAFAGLIPKENTAYHFEAEARAFVEPFTRYLAGALAQCPIPEVRRALAENIHEEENGPGARRVIIEQNLVTPVPEDTSHFGLFLLIPQAMGHDTTEFSKRPLGQKTENFRSFLLDATQNRGWEIATAVSTLFLEGNQHEWETFAEDFPGRVPHMPAKTMEEHPLHVGYGVPPESLLLPAVHHVFDSADGEHRVAAWNILLNHIEPGRRKRVLGFMREALRLWHEWRDEVADVCGVEQDGNGSPVLKVPSLSREV
jgi:hypothetical protein